MGKGKNNKNTSRDVKRETARTLAVSCLSRWSRTKSAIGPVIDTVIYRSGLGVQDRQLGVMLVNGVLRQKQYLDSIIEQFSSHPLRKMKTLMKMTLRTGIYQVVFLDRIPDSAAVNETVKVLQALHQPRWMINFANGVLRSVVRKKSSLPGVDSEYNHPEWLVRRWQTRYGSARTREICRKNNMEPILTLRVNTILIDPEDLADRFQGAGFVVQPGRYLPETLVLESFSGSITDLPGFTEGLFHVQDEAAQLVTFLCGPFTGTRYLDCCAGLGGKTCQLAQQIPAGAQLVAVEPNDRRVRLLAENLKRLHGSDVSVFHGSLEGYMAEQPDMFNGVMVDAPCSGTGVIGRHPDIRWNRSEKDLPEYQSTQISLLTSASDCISPGGILVYATCSMEPEENSQVIDAFLQEKNNFTLTDCRSVLPEKAAGLVNASGFLRTDPSDGLDGFFGARLVRVE